MFYDNIVELCSRNKSNVNDVLNEVGIKKSTAAKWKKGETEISCLTLKKLSDYFNVSMDELYCGLKKEKQFVFFTIPICPITKKNHIQIRKNFKTGQHFISQSDAYKEYAACAPMFIPKRRNPIDFPVNIKCVFYINRRITVDLTNLQAAIDDVLKDCGYIVDDNTSIIWSHDGSRVMYDKEHPRTEITITVADDYVDWSGKYSSPPTKKKGKKQ